MAARIDRRTVRAAAMAEGFTVLTITGVGVFLGFSFVTVLGVGIVAGFFMAALIIAASARADSFAQTDRTDHLRLDADQRGLTDDTIDPDEDDRG